MTFFARFGRVRHPDTPDLHEEAPALQELAAPEIGHGMLQDTVEQPAAVPIEEQPPLEVHVASVPDSHEDPAKIPLLNPAFSLPETSASESFKLAQKVHGDPEADLTEESAQKLVGIEKRADEWPDTGEKLLEDMLRFEDDYDPLIRPHVLNVAIRHGGSRNALNNLHALSEMGAITKDTALTLIREGEANTVARRIERFPVGDETLAHALIDAGESQAVLRHHERFPGLRFDAALAERIIDAGDAGHIIKAIERGKVPGFKVNTALVEKLLATGDADNADVAYDLVREKKIENYSLDAAFAKRLVDSGSAITALVHVDELGPLAPEHAVKTIQQGHGEIVLNNKELFDGLVYDGPLFNELAKYTNNPKMLLSKLDKFNLDGPGVIDKEAAASIAARDPQLVGRELYRFKGLDPHSQNHLASQLGYPVEGYPADKNRLEQDAWYARNSYTYLDGPWPQTKIGQLIRRRLKAGMETDQHDASQWLDEFQIPETTKDIEYIKAHRLDASFSAEAVPELRLRDEAGELDLLRTICASPAELRSRFNFSGKPETVSQLFSKPEHQLLYFALMSRGDDGQPLLKDPGLTADMLQDAAEAHLSDFYRQFQGVVGRRNAPQNNFRMTESQLREALITYRRDRLLTNEGPSGRKASELVAELKTVGLNRKRYADDASDWLMRHATSLSGRLKKVWKDRAEALAQGVEVAEDGKRRATVEDGAKSIELWQTNFAFDKLVDSLEETGRLAETGFTREEIYSDELKGDRDELMRVLSAANTIEALSQMRRSKESRNWTEKILPATSVEITPGGGESGGVLEEDQSASLQTWRFDVLGSDDPRGYTIGEDTGCCMTINGASKSCIRAGYDYDNAGFVALYDPSDKLAGQSFWYINPDQPDTLVLDNIETNQGRKMDNMTDLYKRALHKILSNSESPAVKAIRYVNVGEGYTKVDLESLQRVESIPPINSSIYTDAKRQRRLLEIDNR